MTINTALEAEVAYRREQVAMHFRPWRRVGAERRAAGGRNTSSAAAGRTAAGSAYGAPHHP